MYELTHAELDKHKAFEKQLPEIAEKVIKAIPFTTVPNKMKATIAINEIITFASQFRRNIVLWDGTRVPINTIAFIITGSGNGKDSSVRAARKCFKPGYQRVEEEREAINIKQAQSLAMDDGQKLYAEENVYKDYLKTEPPLFMSPTSGPGFIQHINDLGEHDFGAGLMYSGEFGDELAYNQDMTECIKVLSETYDLGEKEIKYTKAKEFRSKEISGQPVSALMVGSPTYILYDEQVKKKFNIAFMSKLARRSWFCFAPEQLKEKACSTIEEMIEYEEEIDRISAEARAGLEASVLSIANHNIKQVGLPVDVDDNVAKLFKVYKRYNSELADSMPNQHSTSVLVRRHLQWKALKLAGALAIIDKKDVIQTTHYINAIRYAELMSEDMGAFEHELSKAEYEKFADFVKTQVDNTGHAIISAHDIKKLGFVRTISKGILHQLITAAASYDHNGIYTVNHEGTEVRYESIIKTDVVGISFKPINNQPLFDAQARGASDEELGNIKSRIASTSNYGLDVADTTFVDLAGLLKKDYAYSPFKFKNGTRSRDGILGGTKWVVMDIDDSQITAEEAHFMLQDINHHIALSSKADNEFKFRVLIELDSIVDVNAPTWKYFYLAIADYVALNVDPLPQSQIFFSYANRKMYSVTDQEPLEVRDFLMRAHEEAEEKALPNKVFSTAQKKAMVDDELTTFNRAFDASMGDGSRSMIWAARKAFFDLAMTHEDTVELVKRINEYWIIPMDDERLERTIVQQIRRF